MVGFCGGIIGVGTDIGRSRVRKISRRFQTFSGGSICVPSAFNFLYGIRPSHRRLAYGKIASPMEGQETVHSVCRPLTHSVKGKREFFSASELILLTKPPDMRLFVTSVLAQELWKYDSKVVPMPWRQAVSINQISYNTANNVRSSPTPNHPWC